MNRPFQGAAVALCLLAACGQPAALPPPPPPASPSPAPTLAIPAATTVRLPTAVRPPPTPEATPTEVSRFAPVTTADWQTGPADARVTIVEYGDFQ